MKNLHMTSVSSNEGVKNENSISFEISKNPYGLSYDDDSYMDVRSLDFKTIVLGLLSNKPKNDKKAFVEYQLNVAFYRFIEIKDWEMVSKMLSFGMKPPNSSMDIEIEEYKEKEGDKNEYGLLTSEYSTMLVNSHNFKTIILALLENKAEYENGKKTSLEYILNYRFIDFVKRNDVEMIREMLKFGMKVYDSGEAMKEAIVGGYFSILEIFVEYEFIDLNPKNWIESPFMHISRMDNFNIPIKMAKFLFRKGAEMSEEIWEYIKHKAEVYEVYEKVWEQKGFFPLGSCLENSRRFLIFYENKMYEPKTKNVNK